MEGAGAPDLLAAELQAESDACKKQYEEEDNSFGVVERVNALLARGAATGQVLSDLRDRHAAQRLLYNWANVYYRRTGEDSSDVTLAPYAEEAQPPLQDRDYPYPGLEPLREDQAPWLVAGRERQKFPNDCLETLRRHHLLILTGPSGSGRLSLVRAPVCSPA